MSKSNDYILVGDGNLIRKSMIGSCCLYPNAGVMLLTPESKKLYWVNEPDNAKATQIRDDIVAKLMV